ncbi:putative casein kinase I like protein [Cucumispora dikerogammari]|nr:putative casein kinase I like protein [Cucumispora dikerogammari]
MLDLSKIYELKELLGTGSFGDVYLCINKSTKLSYAIKLQKPSVKNTLKREIDVYKYLNTNPTNNIKKNKQDILFNKFEDYCIKHDINQEINLREFFMSSPKNYIAKIYCVGYYEIESIQRTGFVMDLFERSVKDFIKTYHTFYSSSGKSSEIYNDGRCNNIEMKDVLMLGCLMLNAIESLHQKLLIHSDIKPANFVFKNDNLILIDYGLTKEIEFCDISSDEETQSTGLSSVSENKEIKRESKKNFRGTVKYASLSAHRGKPLSFKDDIESMIYLLCSLVERLPWSKKDRSLVPDIKLKFIPKYSLFKELLKYIRTLRTNELVDYAMIRRLLLNDMRYNNWEFNMSVFE